PLLLHVALPICPTGAAARRGQPTQSLVSELQQRFGSLWWWPLAAVAVVVIVVIIAILTVWFTRLGAADAAWAAGAALVLPPPSTYRSRPGPSQKVKER